MSCFALAYKMSAIFLSITWQAFILYLEVTTDVFLGKKGFCLRLIVNTVFNISTCYMYTKFQPILSSDRSVNKEEQSHTHTQTFAFIKLVWLMATYLIWLVNFIPGQPSDGPMGLSVALSPATNTVSMSKSMITNASFRTKKLPGECTFSAVYQHNAYIIFANFLLITVIILIR